MPSLKDLRQRIQSVKNTQQITKTMKMVAAAKVRRSQTACENARPFAEKLEGVLVNLAENTDKAGAPELLAGREEEKTIRILAFGSDRGLCGGFNGQLARLAVIYAHKCIAEGKKVQIVTVGRKQKDLFKAEFRDGVVKSYDDIMGGTLTYAMAEEIGTEMLTDFHNGECDRIVMFYNRFVSMMSQVPTEQNLVPFQVSAEEQERALEEHDHVSFAKGFIDYEPEEGVILNKLLPYNLNMQIFRAILESNASEQAARMMAMENATNNAGDMIKALSLKYNRSRQAAITGELIEIISGAEAI
jgi:F-type H+-transporting ATPase subunit gamma